jgi:hypothetical protein
MVFIAYPTKPVGPVQREPQQHLTENITCSRHDIAEKIAGLTLNNNHSHPLNVVKSSARKHSFSSWNDFVLDTMDRTFYLSFLYANYRVKKPQIPII